MLRRAVDHTRTPHSGWVWHDSSERLEAFARLKRSATKKAPNPKIRRRSHVVGPVGLEPTTPWYRGVAGETLSAVEKVRFNGLVMILFSAFENNFHQEQLGAHHRGTLEISRSTLANLLASPGVGAWWAHRARRTFTPEFVRAVESLVSLEPPAESDGNAV